MMAFHWSWIFILQSLLVRPGLALTGADDHIVNDIHRRIGDNQPLFSSKWLEAAPKSSPSRPSPGAIIAGVFGGLGFTAAMVVWYIVYRRRRAVSDVEKDAGQTGSTENLKSEFSPDEKSTAKFDRIRGAFGRAKKSQQSILPIFQLAIPPGTGEPLNHPAPAHIPRYPSMLERSYNSRQHPAPPPLQQPESVRTPLDAESIRSANGDDRVSRRKVRVPPKALLSAPLGRPLPGLGDRRLLPRSPSRRKSWLSRRPFKHPFIPLRDPDPSIHFAPGSPLHLDHYHPSRELLEVRLDLNSPKALVTPKTARREIRRTPVPLYEEEIESATKSARLAEAIQNEGKRTPIPLRSGRHPPNSASPYI